jgi:hypothetical protein
MFALLIFLFFVSFWFQHTSLRGWIFIVNERKRKSGGRLCVFFSCLLFRSFLFKNNVYPSIYKFVAPGLKFPIMLSWPVAGLAHFLLSYQSYYMWWYIYGRNIAWDHDWGKDTHTHTHTKYGRRNQVPISTDFSGLYIIHYLTKKIFGFLWIFFFSWYISD